MRTAILLAALASLTLALPAVAKSSAGEQAFQKCFACHSLTGPDPNTEGPSLRHVVGRAVASQAGFAYSPAMRAYAAKQKHWSRAALDRYIARPQAVVPGNTMGFAGMPNAAERRALLDYLAKN